MPDMLALHRALDTSVHFAAFMFNMLLIHVIASNSNSTLRPYKGVLLLTCVNDILLSGVALICQPVCLRAVVVDVIAV